MNKLLEKFSQLLVLWVVLAAGIGFVFPQALVPLKPYTDWLFAFTMLGIGCLLSFKDFCSDFGTAETDCARYCGPICDHAAVGFVIIRH
jgi:hypothetical protein